MKAIKSAHLRVTTSCYIDHLLKSLNGDVSWRMVCKENKSVLAVSYVLLIFKTTTLISLKFQFPVVMIRTAPVNHRSLPYKSNNK